MANLRDVLVKLNDNLKIIKLNALNNINSGWAAYNGLIKHSFRQVTLDLKNINASITDYTQASDQVRNMAINLMALIQNPNVVPKIKQKIAIDILHLLSAANFPMDFPFVMQNGAANNANTPFTLADLTGLCLDQAQAYFANSNNNFYANEFSLMLNYLININTHHMPLLEAKTKRLITTINNTLLSSLQNNTLLTPNNPSNSNNAPPKISPEEIIYFLRGNAILGLNSDGTYTNMLTLNQINMYLNELIKRQFINCINPSPTNNHVNNINKIDFDAYNPMVTALFQVYDAITDKRAFPESLYKSMQTFRRNCRTASTSQSNFEQSVRWNLVGVNAHRNNCVEADLKKQFPDVKDLTIIDCNTNTAFHREIDFMVTGGGFQLGIQVDGEKYHTFYSLTENNTPDKKTLFRDYCFKQYQYPVLIISEQKNNNQRKTLTTEVAELMSAHLDSEAIKQCITSVDVDSVTNSNVTSTDNRANDNATPIATPLKRDGSPGNEAELRTPPKETSTAPVVSDNTATPAKPVNLNSRQLSGVVKAEKASIKEDGAVFSSDFKRLLELESDDDMPTIEDDVSTIEDDVPEIGHTNTKISTLSEESIATKALFVTNEYYSFYKLLSRARQYVEEQIKSKVKNTLS